MVGGTSSQIAPSGFIKQQIIALEQQYRCAGTREDGSHIEPNDPMWDMLKDTAMNARNTPLCWLQMTPIYGDLAANRRFADAFAAWLASLYRDGVEATLRHYVDQTPPV